MRFNNQVNHVAYNPRGLTTDGGYSVVEGLGNRLKEIAIGQGLTVSSPFAHHPSSAFEIETSPDLFWANLNNKHGVKGYILYADFLEIIFRFGEDASLGGERLERSINSIRCCPKPIIVVLFPGDPSDHPELVRALEGKAYLISYEGRPLNRLAHEIITRFVRPVQY